MNPTISREIMMARHQDDIRAAAAGRLAAEAKKARRAGRPDPDGILAVRAAAPAVRVPQLRRLLTRLLPA